MYRLQERVATLLVRPRGWHLPEKHLLVDGQPVSASLFDFGLHVFHNARRLLERGSGPYFYLPKLESHLEARLWNEVFLRAEESLGIPRGSIKATVLIETILAAFEMEEILYELREHSAGLNAGRWDYIFSAIKKFRNDPDVPAPGPRPGDDDRALHARLHGAAGQDLPPPGGPRHGGHGRVHPLPAQSGDQRDGPGPGARGQGAGVRRRLRRHLGGPPGPRPGGHRGLRRRPGRAPQPGATAAGGGAGQRRPSCWPSRSRGAPSPRPACGATSASPSSTSSPGCGASGRPRSTI